ncbi:MAG: hypothetical protein CL569_01525 [Alphaproteobacteria bacterium]|nr:hypothetical protein [Alphaproteobacteria bacterium]
MPAGTLPGPHTISGTRSTVSYIIQVAVGVEYIHDLADLLVDHGHVGRIVPPQAQQFFRRQVFSPGQGVDVEGYHVVPVLGLRPGLGGKLCVGHSRDRY